MGQVLSIQSWVAYGHVGNAAATLPLQRLGFEVWAVHTVQFSNHPGYGLFRGMRLPPAHLLEVVAGLAEQGVLAKCDALLLGYMGQAGTAQAVLFALEQLRAQNPRALFCCDPVMGDEGRLYVEPQVPEAIQRLLPQADLLTPNPFELGLLSQREVDDLDAALEAACLLREQMRPEGPRIVLVSGLRQGEETETLAVGEEGAFGVRTPYIPFHPPPNGTGDALAALFLGHYLREKALVPSLELAVSALWGLLWHTHQARSRELCLVAAQEEYAQPSRRFRAERRL
ncbi:pyridoxal kinase PdxY [Meiothermus sp. QL-1]|uniref:pyridoxal kinase PdxY n=1 Tax=Meiothermus sp. QL-1 TaxID=2058095 RepID=UPI000E0C9D2B|nr:pyridoxal kinase PdxY [Meiothermus sp. QL-1]RDI95172.1 pyridoxal kinase PdxY [Meiothermus sp. QL-1]